MNPISATKQHKCKVCKAAYTKRNPWQVVCQSTECVITHVERAKSKRERLDRAETRVKLEALATKPELTAIAQKAFNTYVRARDFGQPCISCGKPLAWGQGATGGACDAGHFLSRGAHVQHSFNLDNCHAQCKRCNDYLKGNSANYRIGLIARIGLERVEALECDHELNHYSKDDLREIASKYRQLAKQLKGN